MTTALFDACCCLWLGAFFVEHVVARCDARRRRLAEEQRQDQQRLSAAMNATMNATIASIHGRARFPAAAVAVTVKQPSAPPTASVFDEEQHPLIV